MDGATNTIANLLRQAGDERVALWPDGGSDSLPLSPAGRKGGLREEVIPLPVIANVAEDSPEQAPDSGEEHHP
jgi:hypothetical protein